MSKGQGGSGHWCNKVNHIKWSSFTPDTKQSEWCFFFPPPYFAAVMVSKDFRDSEKPIPARWLTAGEDERKWKWLSLKAPLPRAALWFTKPSFHSKMARWVFLSQEMTWLWVLNGIPTCSALRVGRIQEVRAILTSLKAPYLCARGGVSARSRCLHGSINLPYLLDSAGEQHSRQAGFPLIELSPIAGDKRTAWGKYYWRGGAFTKSSPKLEK